MESRRFNGLEDPVILSASFNRLGRVFIIGSSAVKSGSASLIVRPRLLGRRFRVKLVSVERVSVDLADFWDPTNRRAIAANCAGLGAARWNAKRQAVEFGAEIGECRGRVRSRGAYSSAYSWRRPPRTRRRSLLPTARPLREHD